MMCSSCLQFSIFFPLLRMKSCKDWCDCHISCLSAALLSLCLPTCELASTFSTGFRAFAELLLRPLRVINFHSSSRFGGWGSFLRESPLWSSMMGFDALVKCNYNASHFPSGHHRHLQFRFCDCIVNGCLFVENKVRTSVRMKDYFFLFTKYLIPSTGPSRTHFVFYCRGCRCSTLLAQWFTSSSTGRTERYTVKERTGRPKKAWQALHKL